MSIHATGDGYTYGPTRTGEDILVRVTCSDGTGAPLESQTVGLHESCDFQRRGLIPVVVGFESSAVATQGMAYDIYEDDWWVATQITDYRGAAAALLQPAVFGRFFPNKAPAGEVGRATRYAKALAHTEEAGRGAPRAVAASMTAIYLYKQADNPTDAGNRPVIWLIGRRNMETGENLLLSSSGPTIVDGNRWLVSGGAGPRDGVARRSRVRTQITGELSKETTGRKRSGGPFGPQGRIRPMVNGDAAEGDAVEGPSMRSRKSLIEWSDPTGERGVARADANGASPNGDLETLVDLAGGIRPELVIGIYQWCAESGRPHVRQRFWPRTPSRIPR